MATSVGEFMLARLRDEWGVHRIYGYPGDGLSGVIGAFQHLGGEPGAARDILRHTIRATRADLGS